MGSEAAAISAPDGSASAVILSVGQVSFIVAYLWSIGLYLYSSLLHMKRSPSNIPKAHLSDPDIESKAHEALESTALMDEEKHTAGSKQISVLQEFWSTPFVRCLLMDRSAILGNKDTLMHIVEFGSILVWFYLCDRTNIFWQSEKFYNRDLFMFMFLCLTCVALGSSLQPVRKELLLNRPQTEEWKGWMQVLFLLYHYFEAREMYNAIRIFIAGYVWMTGYGNFSYYYRTGDFSIGRFCQMMWRLNFLVLFCCIVLKNSYMLYYICPMHTIFTVFVYASLGIAPQLNQITVWMCTKIALCFVAIFILWDIKSVFYAIWSPLDWMVGYTDPRKPPEQDRMHEWYFRSGLDRYVWIWGMICAYLHPHATKLLHTIDEMPQLKRYTVRGLILLGVAVVSSIYYVNVYSLPKLEYNKLHPYTSWIPLTLWVILRNTTPKMRIWSMRLYGWLGCITLETYLCQFHIWLHSDLPDGQPKYLLSLIPGYPMVNFAVVTALYIFISNRLFHLTNELKDRLIPHDNNTVLARNLTQMALGGLMMFGIGWVLEQMLVMQFV